MHTKEVGVPCGTCDGRGASLDIIARENGKHADEEFEEIAEAIIFWRGALQYQYIPDTQAFARAQIARLEARADELSHEEDEQ